MEETLIIACGGLVAFGTAYATWLSHSEMGRALNGAPEIQPFLTAIGLLPLMLAAAWLGDVASWELALLFFAVGAPFLIRGTWRLGKAYVRNARAERYVGKIAGRE